MNKRAFVSLPGIRPRRALAAAFAVVVCGVVCSRPAQASQISVPSGASLRDAVARAVPGDEIVLEAGGVYTDIVTLPDKGAGLPITIRSAATLPERRIGPGDRALMPSIGSGSTMAPITITGSNWRLVGLAFRANTNGDGNIVEISGAAANIVIDRVLVEGGAQGQKRGVAMNGGGAVSVTRSHFANIWKSGQDSQALAAWDGPGPFTITDNYLEAASENILFGGADSSSPARMPADILVEGNHLTKQQAWRTVAGRVVKNLFELKAARRVIVRNNLMEANWVDGQGGWAIVITPRNQDGGAPWTAIEDVLFENNVVRQTTRGVNITGRDDLSLSAQTRRITLRNNVFVTELDWLQAINEIGELTLDHNTVMNGGTLMKLAYGRVHEGTYTRTSTYAVGTLTLLNSLMQHGAAGYGIWGEASGLGTVAIAHHTRAADVRRNVIAGENGWGAPYPADTQQPSYATHASQFVVSNYSLVNGSSYRGAALDSLDLGAVFNAPAPAPTPAPTPTPTPEPTPTPAPAPAPPALPSPWASQDVGTVGLAGSASMADGVFSVRGAGADVWGSADGLHYVWQRVRGDVDIVARVASVEFIHAWTKAGVMIRQGVSADSPQAFMLVSPTKGIAFQRRVAAGGASTNTAGQFGTAPAWVKLERRGTAITAFQSFDGITWTVVGSDSFTMPRDIYVGLAVSSHDNTRLAATTFDNVSVRLLQPPVSITTPALADGRVTDAYAATLSATGGNGTFAWSLASGSLPPGLTLNPSTGAIAGTPAAGGIASFAVRVTDAMDGENTCTSAFTLRVAANVAPVVTLANATVTAPARVQMTAAASDADGSVARVDFYLGATLLGTDTTAPYEVAWRPAPGTYAVQAVATDNNGLATTANATATVRPAVTLSAPWSAQDVGSVGLAGAAAMEGDTFTLQASGADVWGAADGLHYAWQRVRGDVDLIARVASVDNVHAWTKAGVMIRENLTAGSSHAFMLVSPGKGLAFQRRIAGNGLSTNTTGGAGTAPAWVKLERRGATITAFRSTDGVAWTLVGTDTFTMPREILVGVALSSHDDTKLAAATFDNVRVRLLQPPVAITTTAFAGGRVADPYGAVAAASGGTGTFAWTVASGALPPGLALNAADGTISGTPQQPGTFAFTLRVADAADVENSATAPESIAVAYPRVAITAATPAEGRAGFSYTTSFQASGGTGAFTWRLESGTLPTGLSFDAASATISGTPYQVGAYPLVLRVSDAADASNTATLAVTLTVVGVWSSQDVGAAAVTGSMNEQAGIFTVRASGADVWGAADGFHYGWQRVRGDVDIIARVTSVEYVHAWTKAGVMIRETLTADSPHAYMLAPASSAKGTAFQRRVAAGGQSTSTTGSYITAPVWLKLERRGNVISAFQSLDGITWTLVASDTFTMAQDVYVGLALVSHDNARLATATFTSVQIRRLP